jgi:hypothetical protein
VITTIPTLVTLEDFNFYPFKLVRYVHVDRLFKLLDYILNRILIARGVNKSKMKDMLDLISLFMFISFATHGLACFWIFLGRLDKNNP